MASHSRTLGIARAAALMLALAPAAYGQQTAGNIEGRILDQQSAPVPGATVTAANGQTGYNRSAVTDSEGLYRLSALPIGTYDLKVDMSGFSSLERKALTVSVGQTLSVDFTLQVAQVAESVSVSGASPLVEVSSSSVGGVVDVQNIESLPLNGRQFANLALTIPGVGLGFHSDPTKSTQFSPQIAGGNGRNVNYQIDGGDNNDDTVGGLLQLYPLEAIQEFNFQTARYKAEYGRSNGGVMNIVTKSGTNQYQGSGFTLFRDNSMNAQTETEKLERRRQAGLPTLSVRRVVRRPDRQEPRALLRRRRADPARHQADRRHAGPVPGPGRHLHHAGPRKPDHCQGDDQHLAGAVPDDPLRPKHQLAAVRRRAAGGGRATGASAPTRSTRST